MNDGGVNTSLPQQSDDVTKKSTSHPQAILVAQSVHPGGQVGPPPLRGDQVTYGREPKRIICQYCDQDVVTELTERAGCYAHCCALGLCVTCCWPFCIAPYCMDRCLNVEHTCPNCHRKVGESAAPSN